MDAFTASGGTDKPVFEAEIKPHRSLTRRGLVYTVCFMLAGSLTVTSLMAILGAWPVIGFNGADIALALFMIWLNVRAARARETITLSETALSVTSMDVHGRRRSINLAPYWLNVVLEERAGTVPKLVLTARGVRHEVARQLGEEQKRDLAAALTRALAKWRRPVFENEQLK